MDRRASHLLRFAGFELDPANGLLRKNGAPIKLTPQPFKALTVLAGRPGELVTREDLRQAIWGDETVVDFEHGLNTCIRQVRTALGDEAESAQFIETVPRVGYRFIAATEHRPRTSPGVRRGLAAGVAMLALAAGAYWMWIAAKPRWRAMEPARVAVLPFSSITKNADNDMLAEGLAEDLIARLNAFQGVRVISKTSAFSFRGKNLPLREIGARLRVGAVLVGSVRRSGDMMEIGARLVALPEERELWSGYYVRPVAEVFAVQAEISAAAGKALHLVPATTPRKWPTENPEAYALYLRGRSAMEPIMPAGTSAALKFFEQAAMFDPAYAQAHAGIADAYVQLAFTGGLAPKEAYPRAARAAQRALSLDKSLPEAHLAVGWVKMAYERDWRGAEQSHRQSIELDPNNAAARERYGVYLSLVGRFEEALDQKRLALSLDPLSPLASWWLASTLYYARRYDEAIKQARRTLELDPNYGWAYHTLGQCYEEKGRLEEAIQAYLRSGREANGNLGHAYAVAGRTAEARKLLADWEMNYKERRAGAQIIAMVYIGLGEMDRAFEWLERAYENGASLHTLKVAPVFDRLRPDPRFAQLLQKIGLAEAGPSGQTRFTGVDLMVFVHH